VAAAAATAWRTSCASWASPRRTAGPATRRPRAKSSGSKQTLQKWLRAQQPAATLTELQAQLDQFTAIYNTRRPHRSLAHRATPATAYAARPKASPGDRAGDIHDRVRTDIIGTTGTVTLRSGGQLYHIGVGRTHAGTHVLLLVRDLDIRIIDAATGELLRELTLDPDRNYQPTGRPPGPTPRTSAPTRKPRT
jgi:hypothetical protein